MTTPQDELGASLRRVMRQWTTGVAVLTSRDGDHVCGMTCNSFTSVSVSPPMILVCIHKRTRTHGLVTASGRFALSILPESHRDWADRFAGVHGDLHEKFDDVPHRESPGGAYWLKGALGHFDCRVVDAHEGGTHTIFVAEVEHAEPGEENEPPLVRFRSQYTTL